MGQPVPNDQTVPGGALPVRLVTVDGSAFYEAGGGPSDGGTPLGYQQLTQLTTSSTLTVPAGATTAVISVEGTNVRYRDDGVAPTATVGMPLYAGSSPETFLGNLSVLQFIQTAATATLNVSYYK